MKKYTFFILIIAFSVTGCVGYQHAPTPQYVVANSEKGQTYIIAGWQSLQLGYNISNRFSVFVNGYNAKNPNLFFNDSDYEGYSFSEFLNDYFVEVGPNYDENSTSSVNSHHSDTTTSDKTSKVEIGVGYFLPDIILSKNIAFHYGVQLGIGSGQMKYNSSYISNSIDKGIEMKAKTMNSFVQPVIGLRLKRLFIGLTSMLEYKKYIDVSTQVHNDVIVNSDKTFVNTQFVESLFFEPSIIFQIGVENIRLQAQIISCNNIMGNDINVNPLAGYLTLNCNLNVFKLKNAGY